MAGVQIPITVEGKGAKREINELNAEMKSVANTYKLQEDTQNALGKTTAALKIKFESLGEQLKVQQQITQKNTGLLEAEKKAQADYAAVVEKTKKSLQDGLADGNQSAENIKKLQAAAAKAEQNFNKATKSVEAWGRQLTASQSAEKLLQAQMVQTTGEISKQSDVIKKQEERLEKFKDMFSSGFFANVASHMFIGLATNAKRFLDEGSASFNEWSEIQGKLTQVMKNTMDATDEMVASVHELTQAQQDMGVVSQTTQTAGAQELSTYLTKAETLKKLIRIVLSRSIFNREHNA